MSLFGDKNEVKRDYTALLGKSVHDDILILNADMRIDQDDDPLVLEAADIARYNDSDVEAAKDRLRQDLEHKYSNDVSEIRTRIETLEAERDETQQALDQRDQDLRHTRDQLDTINAEMKALAGNVETAKIDQAELSVLRAGFDRSRQSLNQRNQELYARQEELNNVAADLGSSRRQVESLVTELADKNYHLRETSHALRTSRKHTDETIQRLCRLQRDGIDSASRMDAQRQRIKDLQNELAEARDELGSAQFKLADFEDRVALGQLGHMENSTRLRDALDSNQALQDTNNTLRDKIETQKDSQDQLQAAATRLKSKLTETQTRLDEIMDENSALHRNLEQVTTHRDKLLAREDTVRDTLKAARDKLMQMRNREEETQAENAFAMAQNRALRLRQDELLAKIHVLQESRDIASDAPIGRRNISDVMSLNHELTESRGRTEVLESRLKTAQRDLDVLGQINTMLRERVKGSDAEALTSEKKQIRR